MKLLYGAITWGILLGFSLSKPAYADAGIFIDLALANGGEDLAEVELIDEDGDTDTRDITAGGGFSIAGGFHFGFAKKSPWFGLLSVGYKSDGIYASDGDVSFDRIPIDAMLFYRGGQIQFGTGLTYENGPTLDLEDAGGGTTEFDDALGYLVQLDWRFSEMMALGLRYTFIEYELSEFDIEPINGDNASLRLSFYF